jgi:DNA-binding protein H-NS
MTKTNGGALNKPDMPGVNLTSMTVAELDTMIEQAAKLRAAKREQRRQELRSEFETKVKAEGYTVAEVLGGKFNKPEPVPMPAKYADPGDANRTWSGRGRVPGWLQSRLDGGAKLDDFLIQ